MVLYLKHRKEWEVKIMPTREEIGRRLRECRKTKGISSEKAAIEMGLTASSLRKYESGERTPRDEVKITIADYYGMSVQAIFLM